jgi:hypothetical protein
MLKISDLKIDSFEHRDSEAFRLTLLTEFEKESTSKFESLQDAVDKWRVLYNGVRKDFEVYKVSVNDKDSDYQGTLLDLELFHTEETTRLQMQIDHLRKEKGMSFYSKIWPIWPTFMCRRHG